MALKIRILSPGKTKQRYLQEGIDDFLSRLSHYVPVEMVIVPLKIRKQNLSAEIILQKESEAFSKYLVRQNDLILLDAGGKLFSSEKFARFFEERLTSRISAIDFLIGGEWGLSDDLKSRADQMLSLSRMTFTHDLTRLILLEQIYRAFTILRGEPYHK